MQPGLHAGLANDITPVQRVHCPVHPKPLRLALPTEYRAVIPHEMDLVFCRFVLLKDEHTQGYLMFADYASVQGIFAAAEVATVREIHTIFVAVAVLDQDADFAVRPVSY